MLTSVWRTLSLAVFVIGCGRIDFNSLAPGDGRSGGDGGGSGDGGSGSDGAAFTCPASYNFSVGTSRYRIDAAGGQWPASEAACEADGPLSHLVVIDSMAELAALPTFDTYVSGWVGTSKRTTGSTWLDVTGGTNTILPWSTGYPTASGGADCVMFVLNTNFSYAFQNLPCNQMETALCECDGVPPDPAAY